MDGGCLVDGKGNGKNKRTIEEIGLPGDGTGFEVGVSEFADVDLEMLIRLCFLNCLGVGLTVS